MRLGNYWVLLIWLFLAGGIGSFVMVKRKELVLGRYEMRWRWTPAIILAAPYVVWAAFRPDKFGDTHVYRNTFLRMPTGLSNLTDYMATRTKGKGFITFEYLFKTCVSHSDVAFFFLVALIQFFFLVRIYRKYSRNYWLSLFFFVASTDYLSWVHNGMRQFIAATLVFTCIPLLAKKKYILMCLVVIAAAFIHSAVLVFFPFIFVVNGRTWNVRTIMFILALIVAIYYVDSVSGFIVNMMRDTVYEGDIDIFLNDNGTNIIRVLFYSIPTIMSFVFRPIIERENDPLINICVNLSIISTGIYVFSFFTSGILIGALPIYFSLGNYILLPWLLDEVFNSSSRRILTAIFVVVYCIFFWYQCGPTWGLL